MLYSFITFISHINIVNVMQEESISLAKSRFTHASVDDIAELVGFLFTTQNE